MVIYKHLLLRREHDGCAAPKVPIDSRQHTIFNIRCGKLNVAASIVANGVYYFLQAATRAILAAYRITRAACIATAGWSYK